MTTGTIWRKMVAFAVPVFLGQMFQQLYNTADSVIVGNFSGKGALAAVSSSGNLIFMMTGFFTGLSLGAGVVISRYFGAKNFKAMEAAVHTNIAFGTVCGVLMSVMGIFLAPQMLIVMNTPEDVLPLSVTYFRLYFIGAFFSLMYNTCMGILQAVGDSRTPLYYLIFSSGVNIVFDLIFVGPLNMGVAGAAAATVLSQVVSAVLVMMTLCRTSQVYRLQLKKIRFYGDMLVRIVRIGLPAGLQSVMYSLSNIIIQASVNGFGTDVMAAYTAYGKVDGMYWMVINAFGVAITTFVGQNFGARLYDRMKKSINVCLGISAAVTIALSAVLLAIAKPMLGLFSDDAQVIEIGLSIVYLIVPTYITYIFIEILSGAMRGAGDSLIPTIMTLTGVCLLRVFWVTVVVSAHHELKVLLMSYPITWIVTSAMFLVYYLRGKWLKRCIALQNAEN